MVGMSLYFLADTFFISKAAGANGITALNLVLPIYGLIYALGAMVGVGSAIRFNIAYNQGKDYMQYFSNAIMCTGILSIVFIIAGLFYPDRLIGILGGDATIISTGTSYTRIFMTFTPFFMWSYIFTSFVRNDNDPSVAMAATFISSMFNIVMDYVLVFPCKMGMAGAALATAISPIVSILICCIHFFKNTNTIKFKFALPSVTRFVHSCKLGVSSFIGELSSGIITLVFNILILGLVGNIGVAAYGVVANISLVAVSMFNGVALGSQPLVSQAYATNDKESLKKLYSLGIGLSLILAFIIYSIIFVLAAPIANVFNSENINALTENSVYGLKLYFLGFFFAGINIFITSCLSAIDSPKWASITSVLRGIVIIVISAIVMAKLFKMTGVWLAFPLSELVTMIVCIYALFHKR